MEFTAHFKRKRKTSQFNLKNSPFPQCVDGRNYQGVFTGLCVEVIDDEQAQIRTLHDNGCYGKGSLSRGGPVSGNPIETLLLGLEEACLLAYFLDVLQIRDMAGVEMSWQAYLQAALEYDQDFVLKMAAYLYLKSKNWIIKSGIKFGGDFRKVLEGISANLFYLSIF